MSNRHRKWSLTAMRVQPLEAKSVDGERVARIWRRLHRLRSELETSLPYLERKPLAVRFHRTLDGVIRDFEPLAMTRPPKPASRRPPPPENEAAAD
jgi:hypothetical protein